MITKQVKKVIDDHNFYKDKILDMGIESYSGRGSCYDTTGDIRKHLPLIIDKFNITSIVDAPCGDFNWMKHINLENIEYIGYDIIDEILYSNNKLYGNRFHKKDLLTEAFNDKVDIIICRDFMFHISDSDVLNLIDKFKRSGSKYLLATSFDETKQNIDIKECDDGYGFRQINLLVEPFNMTDPIYSFLESHKDNHGRSIHIWKLN